MALSYMLILDSSPHFKLPFYRSIYLCHGCVQCNVYTSNDYSDQVAKYTQTTTCANMNKAKAQPIIMLYSIIIYLA